MTATDHDAIVIGSGFGGAVTACRLAEHGYRVLVLERGRRWEERNYPRSIGDAWCWDVARPERWNGWMDLRCFRHMAVVQGAAVGGGSLIYANVSAVPHPEIFDQGWPPEITGEEMAPHYAAVGAFMGVQKIPPNQWTPRTKLMQEAAGRIGAAERFHTLDLAISFNPDWSEGDRELGPGASRRFVNQQGVEQGTCIHLGNCDIGCDVGAKNTLDRNYLPWAEKHGAEVRPLHLVTAIEPSAGGYRVSFDQLASGRRRAGSATARLVVVACGSLNSTELLLRCRDVSRTLPGLSRFLGRNWSSNGDFLTPAFYSNRTPHPSQGPTITSAIDFLDRSDAGQSFWIQDGGFPDLLFDLLAKVGNRRTIARATLAFARDAIRRFGPLEHVMPWFAQGVDAANGQLRLQRRCRFFGPLRLELDWDIAQSARVIEAIVAMHQRLSLATGGHPLVLPTWSECRYLVTPHPLGGCNMGSTPETGVVDHSGEAFGHRNLYVIDGSIIPEALGVNPSRTIAALAERAAGLIVRNGR